MPHAKAPRIKGLRGGRLLEWTVLRTAASSGTDGGDPTPGKAPLAPPLLPTPWTHRAPGAVSSHPDIGNVGGNGSAARRIAGLQNESTLSSLASEAHGQDP